MAEKAQGVGNGLFGMILGIIEVLFGSFFFSFATYFGIMAIEITKPSSYSAMPSFYSGLLGAASSMILFGSIYVLIHGIKRIIYNGFMAFLSTKKQNEIPTG